MRFIRQIVIALALTAVFILLSVFSTVEYSKDEKILNSENEVSLISLAIEKFNNFLWISDNISILGLSPSKIEKVPKEKADFEEVTKKTKETLSSINWAEIMKRIKVVLLSDWSRP